MQSQAQFVRHLLRLDRYDVIVWIQEMGTFYFSLTKSINDAPAEVEEDSNELSSTDSSEETSNESDYEDRWEYVQGGYHPVKLVQVLKNRYLVTRKLGGGTFSTVWMCWDQVHKRFVAVKIVKSSKASAKVALLEIEMHNRVRQSAPRHRNSRRIIELLDHFRTCGVNGIRKFSCSKRELCCLSNRCMPGVWARGSGSSFSPQ